MGQPFPTFFHDTAILEQVHFGVDNFAKETFSGLLANRNEIPAIL